MFIGFAGPQEPLSCNGRVADTSNQSHMVSGAQRCPLAWGVVEGDREGAKEREQNV